MSLSPLSHNSMTHLYDANQNRETAAILLALTSLPFIGERLWSVMGQPYWHGINLDFNTLSGENSGFQGLAGDADIVGIPALNGRPNFELIFAIEVKAYKFSLDGDLKSTGHKIEVAEAQADKLFRLGFSRTAILHVLTTENSPDRDRGGSHGWWDASSRGLAALDHFMPLVRNRPRRHHVFVWPCGAHPSLDESRAGAGCPQYIGRPDALIGPGKITSESNRSVIVKSLERMIGDLPRPPIWGESPWPTVFGRCSDCASICQFFWGGSLCGKCGWKALARNGQ